MPSLTTQRFYAHLDVEIDFNAYYKHLKFIFYSTVLKLYFNKPEQSVCWNNLILPRVRNFSETMHIYDLSTKHCFCFLNDFVASILYILCKSVLDERTILRHRWKFYMIMSGIT